jgi:hypothetical protein
MNKRMFYVTAFWDPDAGVYVSESDIIGLHIEAATLDEFEDLLMDIAPDLIMANHMTTDDLKKQTRDLIPAILWQRPDRQLAS